MCSRWRDMTHVLRLWAFAWRHRHLQCDQMAKFLSIFGHLQQYKFAKVGSKFCQSRLVQRFAKYTINYRKKCPRRFKICQSGQISPNLVTLDAPLSRLSPGRNRFEMFLLQFTDFTFHILVWTGFEPTYPELRGKHSTALQGSIWY